MPIAETIVVRLEADTRQFTTGMQQASQTTTTLTQATAKVAGASEGATKATTLLRHGLTGLAIEATGTSGPMGKLAQSLLIFGGGSGLVLGVAGGIAAIALAYRALTADTREAEEAQKNLAKTLQGLGVHAQLTAARMELANAQSALTEIASPRGLELLRQSLETEGQTETRRQEALRRISAAQNAIAAATRETHTWAQKIDDDNTHSLLAEQRRVLNLKEMSSTLQHIKVALESPGFTKIQTGTEVFKTLEGKSLEFKGGDSKFMEDLRRLGASAGKQFALAMITGIQNMQDLLRSVLLQFLSIGLDAVFGDLFGSVIGGAKGGGGGSPKNTGGIKGQAIGPASFALSVPQGLAAPGNPFAMARDADWQRVLRSSLIVARTDGFHS